MWCVEGVLVVVSVPASHDWLCNKLYHYDCFSPFAGRVPAPSRESVLLVLL